MIGVLMDITADRARETELQNALKQQELLLAEVNHRVKNSLQLVVSTLRLQSRRLHFPVTASAFEEAISRVRAIISVHERLYRTGNVLSVDMPTHLRKLCLDLVGDEMSDRLTVEVDAIELPPERAIPLSVIVNELLAQWVKPGERRVSVLLKEIAPGQLELRFEADGRIAARPLGELSLKLITTMAAQIGGYFDETHANSGYQAVLRFSKAEV
ncbi:hypothetical protein AGR4C_pb30089 [Agrobacterium tumefaciens str. Kerr 14]|uniref:histidine kinase n=2 Tax=Agrobacterium tumefaciens TaxID=358 RepID=A0A1S7SGD9_AGRTU|nr:hypothetical protein AGR4C_pb30089 [Agrobacterium tumefaciens str. Kerr 14]